MTTYVVDIAPGGRYAYTVTVTLGQAPVGVTLRISLRWLPRVSRWLCTVSTPDGATVSPPQVVEAGGRVMGTAGTVPGVLRWAGPDVYGYADMGTRLRLLWDAP